MVSVFTRAAAFFAATIALFISIVPTPLHAKNDENISSRERSQIIDAIADLIEENYYDVEKASSIAGDLRRERTTKSFASSNTKIQFAAALTEFLHPFDGHFAVTWTDGEDILDHHDAGWDKIARRTNFGFEDVQVLPGNVGYIRLTSFEAPKIAAKTAVAAMGMVANTDALILDLTNNGGGEPEMVQLMLSYFIGPEPKQVGELYWRANDKLQQYWTQPFVPGERFLDRPLFVLGGAATASAAEMFIIQIKNHKRGKIVGQQTYGAGNAGEVFKPSTDFEIFISNGGQVHAKDVFDGVGIAPDVETSTGKELSHAQILSWTAILDTADDPLQISIIEWAQARLMAEIDPLPLTEMQMQASTGNFGDRHIVYRNSKLIYERGRRAPEILIPAPDDVFFLEGLPGIKINLLRDDEGQVTQMKMTWQDGHVESFPRRQP